jgi:signal transduction histidine kinase
MAVVLLDLSLPDSQGLETFFRIQTVITTIPIIVLTGLADEDISIQAVQEGAQDYLAKGEVTGETLGRAIRYAIERHRLVTNLKQQTTARLDSEARFYNMIKQNADAIFIIDEAGMVRFVNPAAVKLFGGVTEELLEKPFGFPLIMDKPAELELVPTEKGQSKTIAEMRVVAIQWEGRRAYLASLRDITARKQMEEQFRQAQKMEAVGRLAGGVAHDFNNLLTVITGYTELLLNEYGQTDDDPNYIALDQIRKASDRAASLTRQLLAFSRKQVLQPRVLQLNETITEIDKILKRLIGEDIKLTTLLAADTGWVKVDAGQIEQIIINLAVNARDAMPHGGKLTIETQNIYLDETYAQQHAEVKAGPYIMLAVSDTGTGIDAETQAKIFEPFFTTKEQDRGTGLGLATVYGIVKQSGGPILVYSDVGVGTTFKINLTQVEPPDNLFAVAEGAIDESHIVGEIGDILTGTIEGRSGPTELTLFESLGLGAEDVAAAHYVYEQAAARSTGTEVDLLS